MPKNSMKPIVLLKVSCYSGRRHRHQSFFQLKWRWVMNCIKINKKDPHSGRSFFCFLVLQANPSIKRLAISRRKIPVLTAGSKKVKSGLLHTSSRSKLRISFASLGGVNTSSFDKLAIVSNISGL